MTDIEKKPESTRLRVQRFRARQKGENVETHMCKRCGVEKPIGEFGKNKDREDGLQTWCKNCHQEYQREYNRNPKTNPQVGDISPGRKIGKSHNSHFIYAACESCGNPRWVELLRGKPRYAKCPPCSQIGCHRHRTKTVGDETPEEIIDTVVNIAMSEDKPSVVDPMQNLDNFFNSVGQVATEIKSLRGEVENLKDSNNHFIDVITNISQERDKWKSKATEWSSRLVELQNILARPSR